MNKNQMIIIADYTVSEPLTFSQLCEACHLPEALVQELIAHEILHPSGQHPTDWVFDMVQLQRAQTAARLQRDLEVNLAGIALVLDLLEERESLREHVALLEKHLLG